MKKVSVIISNWNGCHLLRENLPGVIEAVKHSNIESEIIVVDDASSDESIAFLKKEYPQISVLALKKNQGFSEANNQGILKSRFDIVLPLNNDMVPDQDFFSYILKPFSDKTTFAVSPTTIEKRNGKSVKIRKSSGAEFKFGFWKDKESSNLFSLTALGGGMAIDKEKFMALGGFDKLYHPFYYEDTDLCYRAWKRGWKIIYAPQAKIYHKCSSTIRTSYSSKQVSLIKKKNYYLFIWKNITDKKLILTHLLALPFYLLYKFFTGKLLWVKAFFLALKQLPEVLPKRREERKEQVLSDREVLNLF